MVKNFQDYDILVQFCLDSVDNVLDDTDNVQDDTDNVQDDTDNVLDDTDNVLDDTDNVWTSCVLRELDSVMVELATVLCGIGFCTYLVENVLEKVAIVLQ